VPDYRRCQSVLDSLYPRLARLGPRLELGLCAAYVAATVGGQIARSHADQSPLMVAWVAAVASTVFARRSHPAAGAWVAAVLLAAVPQSTQATGLEALLPILLGYACGAHAETRPGLIASLALVAGLQIHVGFSEFPNAEIALGILPPWWVGREVRRRRQIVDQLATRTRELEHEEEAFVRLTVQRERARIARDLHDIVSHHLAVIVIHAGAGRLAEPGDPQTAAQRFATIRNAGAEALVETDRLTSILHAKQPARPRLADLLSRASDDGARVSVSPPKLDLPDEIDVVAYHVVQEALTNAMKHAPGAAVAIAITVRDGKLSIDVCNDAGTGPSTIARTGSSIGLAGMRERLTELDGELTAGTEPDGGFRLRAQLAIGTPIMPTPLPAR